MTVNYITIKGFIKDGELNIDLPENVIDGEIEVKLPVIGAEIPWEDRPWTEEELEELLHPDPKTGAEIAKSTSIGAWAHLGIEDGVGWVQEQRRKRQEKNRW